MVTGFDMPDYTGDIISMIKPFYLRPVQIYNERAKAVHQEGPAIPGTVTMDVKSDTIIEAVNRTRKGTRDAALEDLLALRSPEYLASVGEAREQYKAGKVTTHHEVFGRMGTHGHLPELGPDYDGCRSGGCRSARHGAGDAVPE